MLTPEDYLDELLTALAPTPLPHELVPLAAAHGRVLSQDVTSVLSVPPWTNSAMDGYAVRADDVASARPQAPVTLTVSGDVPAGAAPAALRPGTAMRIMTGAMLPDGSDAVVRVEDTDQEPGPHPLPTRVTILTAVRPGTNVRSAGEASQPGDLVAEAGTYLTSRAISALASAGQGQVSVRARVRVGVVSTGAELTDPGQALEPGRIPDSNSLLLAGLVQEAGGEVVAIERAGDSADSLAAALTRAGERADLVITSGGVSAGAFDPLTMLAVAQADSAGGGLRAELTFRKVAMQPGKPQGYGRLHLASGQKRSAGLLMLPGNPVSVLVSFTVLARPLLARLSGAPAGAGLAPVSRARAAAAWTCPAGRRQYVPVREVPAPQGCAGSATPWIAPVHRLGSGSHLVTSLPQATHLAAVPAEQEAVAVGDELELLPLT